MRRHDPRLPRTVRRRDRLHLHEQRGPRRRAGRRQPAAAAAARAPELSRSPRWRSPSSIALPLGLWLGHTRRGVVPRDQRVQRRARRPVDRRSSSLFFAAYSAPASSTSCSRWCCSRSRRSSPTPTSACAQVDRDTVDAARGMGMTGAQIVRQVELPLALPLIFGGIRTSAVNVIATATIAPAGRRGDARRPDHQRHRATATPAGSGRPSSSPRSPSRPRSACRAVQRGVTPEGLKLSEQAASRRRPLSISKRRIAPTS